ncbi:MAG: undecaprenyldiphospho-muramoylpentapeptide beta-N-acetylglucosaminyltransferase [Clostridiales bacterium]|nr:undecaprenyldiphospho-muramoylpentapeptide beta-N-acetylglucosaminyltransferase [Clostridiales bacterium]
MKTIVFTGGGTGGHIMPNISIIERIKDKYKIYYLGTNGMEKDIISNLKYVNYIEVPAVKFTRSLTPKNLLIPLKLFQSIKTCKKILKEISPNLIFSKGGYVSIPVCLAGQKLNIPTITHESDLTIGLANRIIARKSKYLCCSFLDTALQYQKNAIHTGSPIRQQIYHGKTEHLLQNTKIDTTKPIITVVGGSLGAQAVNDLIWQNIDKLTQSYTIIHITGKNKINKTIKNTPHYIQIEFTEKIEDYFKLSDLIISRAGSNTIFELLALKKPMLLIPLPKTSSRGDQILNAKNFQKKGYAEYILQENLNYETLTQQINHILKNKIKYISQLRKNNNADGTDNIIKIIERCIK